MVRVTAAALIPSKDHLALLDSGPCGARPPLLQWSSLERRWLPLDDAGRRWMDTTQSDRALVIAWDSKPLLDGINRIPIRPTRDGGLRMLVDVALSNGGEQSLERWAMVARRLREVGQLLLVAPDVDSTLRPRPLIAVVLDANRQERQ